MKTENKIRISGEFERFFFDDEEYHEKSPMLYHKHKGFCEIHYLFSGKESYRVDDRSYELRPGCAAIIDRNVWHGEEPFLSEKCVTYTAAIKNIRIHGEEEDIIRKNRRAVVEFQPGGEFEKLMFALSQAQRNFPQNRRLSDQICCGILELVYDRLLKTRDGEDHILKKNDELIRKAIAYLDEHYMEEVNLDELGSYIGLSRYYLAHLFKSETGVSPIKYAMIRRVGEAQNLLKNTSKSVGEIADLLGFGSNCHLCSVFKKYFGISPKSYRQHYKENSDSISPGYAEPGRYEKEEDFHF